MDERNDQSPSPERPTAAADSRWPKLLGRLEQTVRPLARRLGLALGISLDGNLEWLEAHESCRCRSLTGLPPADSAGDSLALVPIPMAPEEGLVVLCPGAAGGPGLSALVEIVGMAWAEIERDAEQESLLTEIGACWECLDTLFRIHADLREIHQAQVLLNRILERAVTFHAGLKAVLWIESEGRLKAVACRNTVPWPDRDPGEGLIGKTIRNRMTTVLNARTPGPDSQQAEPELSDAVSLVIAPAGTREALIGALALWHDTEPVPFDSTRIRLIESVAMQAAAIVESDRFHQASLEGERLKNELEIGAKIQQMLLFKEPPQDIPGLQIGVIMIPSRKVDGDFCEYIRHSNNCLDIAVGDVMGKGIPAALVGAATKSQILRSLCSLLAVARSGTTPSPAQIVNAVHQELSERLIDLDCFVTLCYARIDLDARQLDLVDCGHTKTIHVDAGSGSVRMLSGDNLPLGVSMREVYTQNTVPFSDGDMIVFYSDGITEARDPEGAFFGETGLARSLQDCPCGPPDEFIRTLRQDLAAFTRTEAFADDLTCVAVRIGGQEPAQTSLVTQLELSSRFQQLGRLREWLREVYARDAHEDEDGFHLLDLALTEVFTNIVRHACHEEPGYLIRIQAESRPHRAVITVTYPGEFFDPGTAPPPDFDGNREGGFGLYIISQAVDEVSYSQTAQGDNQVRLVKRFQSIQQGECNNGATGRKGR